MFTLVCALVFGQVTFAQYSCPCGPGCPCSSFGTNCGGANCPGNSRQNFRPQQQQGNFCGPNGCQTVTQYRNTIPNAVNYGSCANGSCANANVNANVNANANTCGPNGCSNAQVNNRFYNYPRYRTRRSFRFRVFRRW